MRFTLNYRVASDGRYWTAIEDLAANECTIHRAAGATGRWWLLWFYVARETDGVLEDFAVPVNPNGPYVEGGPGGKCWGLTKTAAGVWQISPSINVLNAKEVHPGPHPLPSLWHQTPTIVGIPDGEPWIAGQP
jgi:hypothetical protein